MALSIKQKQVLGVTSIVALVVINLSLLHLTTFGDLLLRQNEERANALSESVFHRVQDVVTSHETAFDDLRGDTELQSVLESAILLKNVTYAAIVDRDGLIVAHSDRARMGERLPDATDLPALVKQGDEFKELGDVFASVSNQLKAALPAGAPRAHLLELSRRVASLGRLTAGVAHEVKNPLNAKTIHLELLREKMASGAAPEATTEHV